MALAHAHRIFLQRCLCALAILLPIAAAHAYDWLQFGFSPDKMSNLDFGKYETTVNASNVAKLTQLFQVAIPDAPDGSAVALSIIRELGPVLSALMVTGRAGSAMTAEIGLMRITEQIDALDTMAVSPMQYLVAPKVLAGVLVMPLLVAIFDLIGIYGGHLVGVNLLGVSSGAYTSGMQSAVEWKEVYGGILKALSFGLIVTWVCTYKGYNTGMSAEGLGKATTEAVVLASVLVLIWDYFLTSVLL